MAEVKFMTISLGADTTRTILLVIWIILLLTVVAVVGMALYANRNDPETLKQWGSICLGFVFGALFSMLKERT